MSLLSSIGKNLLKLIPGVSQVVTILDTAGDIAAAVGGATGDKIAAGIAQVTEGLAEADAQAPSMTPEQRLALEQAGQRHEERMAELDLAKAEVASEDQYVRRTRCAYLRLRPPGRE